MIVFLRGLFVLVIVSMLAVTGWAGWQCPLFAVPREVLGHPWFIATLFDAYWGFATFYVWVYYKQASWVARLAWFIAIMLLGNIAMASYCLSELFRVPHGGRASELLVVRRTDTGILGIVLAVLGCTVLVLA